MGCFLGCFGGEKELGRRKQRIDRLDRRTLRNRIGNVAENRVVTTSEVTIRERNDVQLEQKLTPTTSTRVVPELLNKPDVVEQLSPSPKKRVTFNANVTTYEPVPDHDKVEQVEALQTLVPASSIAGEENSISSSVASSYPPNHRYHDARDSEDEAEYEDLDDLEDDLEDCYEDEEDSRSLEYDWSESVRTESVESSTGKMPQKSSIHSSVLAPVENITQWKAAVLSGLHKLQPEKENLESNIKSCKNTSQEVSVDASLSGWLESPGLQGSKKASFSGFGSPPTTNSDGRSSRKSLEDRPILGALTVEELRQISVSSSAKKSPSKSPDEVPIVGTVGSYWSDSGSAKSSCSPIPFNGAPNTSSKFREDKRVHWHSTPFESK